MMNASLQMEHARKKRKAEYMRKWRKKNPGYSSKYTTAWARNHRERDREHKIRSDRRDPRRFFNWRLKKRYGITVEDYEALLEKQGGVCAICHEPATEKRLTVDHDHVCCDVQESLDKHGKRSCGKCVRGLLCDGCNKLLAFAKDSKTRLEAAILYLERGTEE